MSMEQQPESQSEGFFRLAGSRALVTGGSRGIGAATAVMLARAGADVGVVYRSRADEAKDVERQIAERGRRAWSHSADLGQADQVDRLFTRCHEEFGGLDLCVANAGIWPSEEVAVAGMSDDQWRRTVAVNLDGVFHTVRRAAAALSDGGRIVLVSSTAGQRGEAFHADYAATKGALFAFAKSVAVELAPRGITVNCVAPGWVDTEMVSDVFSERRDAITRTIPLGRVADAADVAGPIVFLCSEMARHITGEVLNVNGGSVLCG